MAGNASRIQGLQFENILKFHAKHQGIHAEPMPIAAKRFGRKIIQIKSNFDFILIYKGVSIFIDCKTYDSNTLSFSKITPHQMYALSTIEDAGCRSGYLCHFRPNNSVIFFEASKLRSLQPTKSLTEADGIYIGPYENMCLGTLFVEPLEARQIRNELTHEG